MLNNQRLKAQFEGFLKTPSLWLSQSPIGIAVFDFPPHLLPSKPISSPSTTVLGKRAECFFEESLKASSLYSLMFKNIQIYQGKRTIGELDFIIFEKGEAAAIHLELVYKIYLFHPKIGTKTQECWVGPNLKDSMGQKLQKLKNRQFPLIHKTETLQTLESLGVGISGIRQKLCFKAQLFLPFGYSGQFDDSVNQACIRGWWYYKSQFEAQKDKGYLYHMPEKQDWMQVPQEIPCWLSYEDTLVLVNDQLNNQRAPMLWIKRSKGISSCFVVWW